ncbi:tetratricopeptide (TPR) repeat protein [Kribbella aluminosa]|uniref:Tetratricopeptide (TPR) repeat protein n=1 Tax=Kribbella aluminosa TaxID=416017 RepID=A0ABS4UZT6_9ACTN|nr:tetratricopeptide repeat protein [Kribbella aluminosa]MBP2357145.1 tetratricopeptide (TPR) repeat protein [Kribbella aluminosa]
MRAKQTAFLLAVVFVVYAVLIGWRGVLLIGTGELVAIVLGIAVLVIPLLGAYVVWREIQFGRRTEVLARELEAAGGLPVDDLPRRPSGRIDRAAADAAFGQYRAAAEAAPDDWRVWFRLSTAYDAAGDRRRAREAMRKAIGQHDAES